MDISIVIPCYRSGENIRKVVSRIDEVLTKEDLSYEIIMVNDGSPDNTFEIIDDIASKRTNTLAIDLARNKGQHAALMAGFHYAQGDYIITHEDDGQSDAAYIPQMVEKLIAGYDVAALTFTDRGKRSLFRRFGSFVEETTSEWMIPRPKGIYVPIFFAAKRFVIEEVLKYDQPFPYLEGLILRSTYNIALVEGNQKERMDGASGYTLTKLIRLWLNGFTSFSIMPLRLATVLGFSFAGVGVLMGLYIAFRKLIHHHTVPGWTSTVSSMLLMFGLVLTMLGLIGEYVGRIYMCINKTPQFLVRRVTGASCQNQIVPRSEGIVLNLKSLDNSADLLTDFYKAMGYPGSGEALRQEAEEKLRMSSPIAMVRDGRVVACGCLYCAHPEARLERPAVVAGYAGQNVERDIIRYARQYAKLCGCIMEDMDAAAVV